MLCGGDSDEGSSGPAEDGGDTVDAPKKTPTKRKKAAAPTADDETAPNSNVGDGHETGTPTKPKRQRKTPAKKKGAAGNKNADDNDKGDNG